MAERADIRLGIHDASRLEWMAELPLPERGAEELDLELSVEIPGHLWSEHDHWERLQLMARLSSPSDEGAAPEAPGTVDALRRATLGAASRSKDARSRVAREIFLAGSLLASTPRTDLAETVRTAVREALDELRAERTRLATGASGEPAELTRERALAAEFLSNHAIEFVSRIQRAVDEQLCGPRSRLREAYAEAAAELRAFLAGELAAELAYRELRGMLRPDDRDPWLLERFVARASLLKKHFQEVLFLELDAERSYQRFRNWFGVVAASLAALWAFPLGFLLTGGGGTTGLGLGLGTTIALLVLSYAVKDRIKESVRAWLATRVEKGYAGRLTELKVPARLLGTQVELARVRESFFLSHEHRPDPLHPDLGLTRPVVRLRYRMRGSLLGDRRLGAHGHERVKLVFRYDLSPLFNKLDDPIKHVPVLDSDGKSMRFAEAARCYRLPVRLEVRHRGALHEQGGVLVTHKLGLERIERAAPVVGSEPQPEGPAPLASIPWSLRRR